MRFFTTVHILLLGYVIAALVFWGISLNKQSEQIFIQERILLSEHVDSTRHPQLYKERLHNLEIKKDRRKSQYLGEGSTFLLIILIGAAVVYSSFRRSISLSKQQNNFMLSVTHELKSPIAAMKLNMQTLQRHELDEEKRDKLVERCILEANRLNDLCNNMLIASQMEGRQYIAAKEELNFTDLVGNILYDYMVRYPNRFEEGIMLKCVLKGDKLLLSMAISNLLENAVKYTPQETPVVVSVISKNGSAIFQVADHGPGISDKEKSKVFSKFYRIGNEETRKTKGTGLGLYLTLKIVKQHYGMISIKDNTPKGSIFEINLPLA